MIQTIHPKNKRPECGKVAIGDRIETYVHDNFNWYRRVGTIIDIFGNYAELEGNIVVAKDYCFKL